jgi:hypothetical protein
MATDRRTAKAGHRLESDRNHITGEGEIRFFPAIPFPVISFNPWSR